MPSYYDVSNNLITLDRAKLQFRSFNSANDAALQACVSAASQAVQRYCQRNFVVTAYDELYDGTGSQNLLLNQFPLIQVTRISWNRQNVLQISNMNQSVSRASWRLDRVTGTHTASNLNLTWVIDGVETQVNLPLSGYVSIASLAAGVEAVGNGWTAFPFPVWSENPITDLRAPQGASNAQMIASYICDWTLPLWNTEMNEDIGEIFNWFRFQRGYRNYRCQTICGFADENGNTLVPEPIQAAVAEVAAGAFLAIGLNPNLLSETLQDYSYTRAIPQGFDNLSLTSKLALASFKNHRVSHFNVFGD